MTKPFFILLLFFLCKREKLIIYLFIKKLRNITPYNPICKIILSTHVINLFFYYEIFNFNSIKSLKLTLSSFLFIWSKKNIFLYSKCT